MFLTIASFIVLTITIVAGVLLGTDLSRRVDFFPGCLIIILASTDFLLQFNLLTSFTIGCLYFLMGCLSIIIIYLKEKQRSLIKVRQQANKNLK